MRTGSVTSLVSPSLKPKAVLPMIAALGCTAAARQARRSAGASPMPATRGKDTPLWRHRTRPSGPGATLLGVSDTRKATWRPTGCAPRWQCLATSHPAGRRCPHPLGRTHKLGVKALETQGGSPMATPAAARLCTALRRLDAAGGAQLSTLVAETVCERHEERVTAVPLALRTLGPAGRGGGFRVLSAPLLTRSSDAFVLPRRCKRQASTDAALSVAERLVVTHDAALAVRGLAALGYSSRTHTAAATRQTPTTPP